MIGPGSISENISPIKLITKYSKLACLSMWAILEGCP